MPCRIGDVGGGRCPAHDSTKSYNTVFSDGAVTVIIEGSPVTRIGDIGLATCGHPTVALDGTPTVFAEGSPCHGIGGAGANAGGYASLSGAVTVFTESR